MNITERIVRATRMVWCWGIAVLATNTIFGAGAWLTKAPMPEAMFGASACEVDGIIYVIGVPGYVYGATRPDVYAYDPTLDTWQKRARAPTVRGSFAACVVDGLIFVLGGRVGTEPVRTVEVYDPRTDSWSARLPMRTARSSVKACAIDGVIYVLEAFDTNLLEAYDPAADSWTEKTHAPFFHHPQQSIDGQPAVANGILYVGASHSYDPRTDSWHNITASPPPGATTLGAIDGKVYLTSERGIVVFDPVANTITDCQSVIPTSRMSWTSAVCDGRIYVLGGAIPWGDILANNDVYVPDARPPSIGCQPAAQTVTASGELTLSVGVDSTSGPCRYQWRRDGIDIPGATGTTLTLPCAQRCHAGAYAVVITNEFGSTTSEVAQVTIEIPATNGARLLNLSNRALCLTGESTLIPGFVIAGSGTKQVLLRAVGPKLAEFGVSGALADPTLRLRRLVGDAWMDVAANDDWAAQQDGGNSDLVAGAAQRVGAFDLDLDGRDAALLVDLAPGVYSVAGAGNPSTGSGQEDGCTGVELVELYDADRTDAGPSTARFANLSTRGFVGAGAEVMIPGFVVSIEGPKTFLVRAVGPGLQVFGVSGVLADPKLALFRRQDGDTPVDQRIAESDDWSDVDGAFTAAVAEQVGAFALAAGSKDAAMVVTLPPGVYSAVASGAVGGTGIALVELYEVP